MPENDDVSAFDVGLLPKLPPPERLGRQKSGGFLTPLDRATLARGATYQQLTKRVYRGPRIDRERKAHAERYTKARAKALKALPGVMEDLLTVATHLDPEALYAAFLAPVRHGNDAALVPLLEALALGVGMERMPQERTSGFVRGGPFAVVAMLGALERGLNAADRGSGQRHRLLHTLRNEPERIGDEMWQVPRPPVGRKEPAKGKAKRSRGPSGAKRSAPMDPQGPGSTLPDPQG